ncbi:MAG: 1-acyl-sn-glycerol-3-phosphate acyltransferase [Petroclostridium sp.]|jgi:1-acyl-sn-glycerol-3-phosphate acyltransferase|nr:1-acyl-sn-glycerol-3-phosphate acyltransferase [Clostridia bacterium]MDK2810901.1 1-acyl-sn-glycerol-3-phosphate acyltransferase [Petroclostridium sp.]
MFYNIVKYLIQIIAKIIFRIEIRGLQNVPTHGACIICFNHKSTLDPPVIGVFIPRQLVFMAKEELFKVPVLGFIIKALGAFPIKRGAGDVSAIKNALSILKEGKVLAMYPEGTRSKSGDLNQAKPGVALIATRAKVPVVPVGVTGEYKLFHKLLINIGNPIVLEEYYNQKLSMDKLQEISNDIMNQIKELMEVN